MTHTWSLRGWEHPRHGEDPRVVIIAADNDQDAAHRCLIFCNVIAKATSDAR